MTYEETKKIISRRLQVAYPSEEEVLQRLGGEKKLQFYWGADPTGPLHIGHLIPLLLLKDIARIGHKVTILIGDFTARIGDPTDKEAVRIELSAAEVKKNGASYPDKIAQVFADVPFDIKYNSSWLEHMTLAEALKMATHATVQQMIAREMFRQRLKQEKPIYIHEFFYPLLQGYDSVAMEVDGEIGGNDQTFNMLIGRDMSRAYLKKDKMVIAVQLLVDLASGKKVSKTEESLISFTDSPQEIRRKVLNYVPNEMLKTIFNLCTEVSLNDIEDLFKENHGDFRTIQESLVKELISIMYGAEEVKRATRAVSIALKENNALLSDFVAQAANISKTEAKNIVTRKGVQVNGNIVDEWKYEVKIGDQVTVGKGKFFQAT